MDGLPSITGLKAWRLFLYCCIAPHWRHEESLFMTYLIIGLILFLGVHSLRVVAGDWRARTVAGMGEGPWKGIYSLASLAGFVLLVWGYGLARQQPLVLWTPPVAMRHVAALLTLPAFVLLVATYVPHNHFKARLHHPMLLATKLWALAHLLANGTLADLLLFGSFLVWAIVTFAASRRRDRRESVVYPPGRTAPTLVVTGLGLVAWLIFAMWLHGLLIGVKPFG
jgi:uncharacterized membrane protein